MRALTLLGAGISLAGAAVMAIGGVPYWTRHQSLAWAAADAEVLRSQVLQRNDKHGVSDWADLEFRYVVAGRAYTGNVVRFGPVEFDREGAEATVHAYPRGAHVKAWVDPKDPKRSVLDRDKVSSQAAWKVVFGGSLLFAGIGMLAAMRKNAGADPGAAAPPA